jgi:hypothetical protein
MTSLPETTKRRLQRLPQLPHVWEGDRISILGIMENIDPEMLEDNDCIIWLDASEGFVRSMEIVRTNMGQEAMIRSLLKAMENPQNPAEPARPHQIVVKDRELQFLLRGVLQDLDIKVVYQPELPLLDELWQNFQTLHPQRISNIAPELLSTLEKVALFSIWEDQPWDIISEEEILQVEINHWGIDSLYICVMGMLGQEFGVVLYRSLESLKSFRQKILDLGENPEEGELETAFLQQDCWFLNFSDNEDQELSLPYSKNFSSQVRPIFGSIHPYEGIRSLKEEEEVLAIYIALKTLAKFTEECDHQLLLEHNEEVIERRYKFKIPQKNNYLKVHLTTMPEFTADLEKLWHEDEDDIDYFIDHELIPDDTLISFKSITQEQLLLLKNNSYGHIPPTIVNKIQKKAQQKEFPVIILQTTRPKAKELMNQLQEEQGIKNIAFAIVNNPKQNVEYDLGIFQTGKDNFYLLAQFPYSDYLESPRETIDLWKNNVIQFHGYCGIIIAVGAKGSSRGNPKNKDLLCLFYVRLSQDNQLILN